MQLSRARTERVPNDDAPDGVCHPDCRQIPRPARRSGRGEGGEAEDAGEAKEAWSTACVAGWGEDDIVAQRPTGCNTRARRTRATCDAHHIASRCRRLRTTPLR